MLLVEFTINAVVNYLSVDYINSLTHQWRGRISNFDPPQRKLPYDYGGYCEMGYGSISFFPDLFDDDWPPPINGAITIKYTATTEGAAETLFVGTAHREEINRSGITYGLYGPNFDETIADATAYNNTLNVILTAILEGIAEITTLNTTNARAVSPNVLHTTSGLKLNIDLASSIAAFYTHLFYVNGTTAYLIDMLGDSGTITHDEFDFYAAKYPYNPPIALARSGDFSRTSAYAYGKELSVAQYHDTEANVNVCLDNIITIMNRPRVEVPFPFLGSIPTPGKKLTWTDESQGSDLAVDLHVRNITYEFNPDRDEIILKGDGKLFLRPDLDIEDISSGSEITVPSVQAIRLVGAANIESASEITVPSMQPIRLVGAEDIESPPEITVPTIIKVLDLNAEDISSPTEITVPSIDVFAFKFTILTLVEDDTFTLPIYNGGTYDFNVDWGDSSNDNITAWDDAAVTHTYADAGATEYTITIKGTITGWRFANAGDKLLMKDIQSFGPLNLGNLLSYFYGCTNLTISATDTLDLTGTTNLNGMFWNCSSLTTIPSMALWDTSSVTNMRSMFSGCTLFNESVANFDTSKVTDIAYMFFGCAAFNQSVANFDTALATNMSYMFADCAAFNQSVANFDTSNVNNMSIMFTNCILFNQSVANFNTSKVINMSRMFKGCTLFNQSVANFDTSLVTTMLEMFYTAAAFNQDVSGVNWVVTALTNATNMFFGANALSTANYDLLLVAWEGQAIVNAVTFHAGDAQYSAGAPATARAALIADHTWAITDGGQVP